MFQSQLRTTTPEEGLWCGSWPAAPEAQERVRNANAEMLVASCSFTIPPGDADIAKLQEPMFRSEQPALLPGGLFLINTSNEALDSVY